MSISLVINISTAWFLVSTKIEPFTSAPKYVIDTSDAVVKFTACNQHQPAIGNHTHPFKRSIGLIMLIGIPHGVVEMSMLYNCWLYVLIESCSQQEMGIPNNKCQEKLPMLSKVREATMIIHICSRCIPNKRIN